MALQFTKYRTDNPKDVVSARKLKLSTIQLALETRAIKVVFLDQLWRHVHGKVIFKDQISFLKLATTSGISKATRNETVWNNHLNKYLKHSSTFAVPKIFSTHIIDGKFFYLGEYFEARKLCDQANPRSYSALTTYRHAIVDCMLTISSLPTRSFIWDRRYSRLTNPGKKFFKRALGFSQAIGSPENLKPLIEIAQVLCEGYEPGLNHGDMAPWHLLIDPKKRLILTDGEWGCSCLPKYYDLAYCYQRLCGCVGQFEQAANIASNFRQQLPNRQRQIFDRQFRGILAERCIGGFWDLLAGKNTASGKASYHHQLLNQILKNDLY